MKGKWIILVAVFLAMAMVSGCDESATNCPSEPVSLSDEEGYIINTNPSTVDKMAGFSVTDWVWWDISIEDDGSMILNVFPNDYGAKEGDGFAVGINYGPLCFLPVGETLRLPPGYNYCLEIRRAFNTEKGFVVGYAEYARLNESKEFHPDKSLGLQNISDKIFAYLDLPDIRMNLSDESVTIGHNSLKADDIFVSFDSYSGQQLLFYLNPGETILLPEDRSYDRVYAEMRIYDEKNKRGLSSKDVSFMEYRR